MNNYLVQYKSYMLPTGRQFTIGGASIAFSKNKMVVDVFKEVERQTKMSIDNDKFKAKVNEVYSSLIANYKCEPYMSMENAKNCIIDTRNNDILGALKLKRDNGVEKLRLELSNKLTNIRLAMEKEASEMETKLRSELDGAMGEVNKEEAVIFHAEKELKSGEIPDADKIRLTEEMAQAQQRAEALKNKFARQTASINSKIDTFKKSKEKDMRAVENEYATMINEFKKKADADILNKALFLTKRKQEEIVLIDKILNFEVNKPDEKVSVTKDVAISENKKEVITEKAKANEKKPAKK